MRTKTHLRRSNQARKATYNRAYDLLFPILPQGSLWFSVNERLLAMLASLRAAPVPRRYESCL